MLIDQAFGANGVESAGNGVQCLFPFDFDPAWILVAPLLRIGPLQWLEQAVGVVDLLHQAVGLDTDLAIGRMQAASIKVGGDRGGDAVLDLDGQHVGAIDALITVG
ncbi:hypothetical protein SDC9_191957 [bioreactor metagenome]|uniref:Uncharacterized protein n=1 Tax=bioreactor metagenome TaxID=1076179 RepID=A0A645I0W8_9ZZZZ